MTDVVPKLLVSVRDAQEAEAAVAGGADVIDIKDPARGPLGMASPQVIASVIDAVAGRRPVTAALGELNDWPHGCRPDPRLAYVKMALADAPADWRDRLGAVRDALRPLPFIATAYADHERANAPSAADVLSWVIDNNRTPNTRVATRPWSDADADPESDTAPEPQAASQSNLLPHHSAGLLIDTAVKDGKGLLHWMSEAQLQDIIARARQANLLIALAGSLHGDSLRIAADLSPDLVAVRGAVCAGRDRQQSVDAARVAALKQLLSARTAPAAAAEG